MNEKILDNRNKVIVDIDKKYFRPIDVENLKGDSSKARKILNWKPKYNIDDLVKEMCLFEIENGKKIMIKVYIAGHTGMVGSSITRKLSSIKKFKIIKAKRSQLNLLNYRNILDL